MKIKQQDGPPSDLLYFDNEMNLTKDHVEDIVEIFNTPLTGAYNWDYTVAVSYTHLTLPTTPYV